LRQQREQVLGDRENLVAGGRLHGVGRQCVLARSLWLQSLAALSCCSVLLHCVLARSLWCLWASAAAAAADAAAAVEAAAEGEILKCQLCSYFL